MIRSLAIGVTAVFLCQPASAVTFSFPGGARLSAETTETAGSQRLPVGPYADGDVVSMAVEGTVTRRAWQVGTGGLTTLQILAPLREQLQADGYDFAFECRDRDCGGFDFRNRLDLLPAPDMHVNLGDFRYLLARRTTVSGADVIALVVSRAAEVGFVHVTRVEQSASEVPAAAVDPSGSAVTSAEIGTSPNAAGPPVDLGQKPGTVADGLHGAGHFVLEGLVFETGSSELSESSHDELAGLAAFLLANPDARVALVGHTDAVGQIDQNIRLSRRRAESVRSVLLTEFGVPAAQVSADGAGYLAPRATNLTEEGRASNRRVEAVLLNTE